MTKKIRNLVILSLLSLLVAFMVACNDESASSNNNNNDNNNNNNNNNNSGNIEDSPEDIEFRFMWWGGQNRHDRTISVIELYEERNPHVTIHYEFLNFDDFSERLATQSAAGNAPDVFQIVDRWLPQYAEAGLLADLQPYIDSGDINTDNIDQSALDPGYVGDELVALNAGSNAHVMIYNPAMFDEAGLPYPEPGYTWAEYADMAREIQQALDLEFGMHVDIIHDRGFGIWLRQNDMWLYNDDATTLGWDDDQIFLDHINFYMDLVEEGVAPPPDVTEAASNIEDLLITRQQVPMQTVHSNQIVAISNAANHEFGMTTLPANEDRETGQYIRASQFFSINANTDHKEEIVKFLDFLTNDIEANDILGGERGVPISSEIRDHLYDDAEKTIQQQFDYIEMMSDIVGTPPPPPPPAGEEMDRFFNDVFYEVYYGVSTVEEALEKYKKGVQDIIDR
ncbi:sugar ABC transporter substrate-binding protein [Evansella sp. AB-P1]|uniref:ABC transporter substrate-binding protein n=1 Tax=Evansella sp. AB-P1 TaxID=3037653 RepID=UPI00241D8B1B|nr:sugar ABC transporter substrate-binding protein [Evansella sp. AB-P1]MDG5786746.1 sugar ABC transporter substrate-binding protein [Evansella sp. AB-P1]